MPKIERVPPSVWIHAGNELDENRADWLGNWGLHVAMLAEGVSSSIKVCLFNFAAGEPEPYHWKEPGMKRLLIYAGAHKDRVAVGLHEYSYEVEDVPATNGDPLTPAILRGFPWMVGRFAKLFEELSDRAAFFQVDADRAPLGTERLGVRSVPAVVAFARGQEKW